MNAASSELCLTQIIQKKVFAFDDENRSRMLVGVDENGRGFASNSERSSSAANTKEIVCLSEKGGVYSIDGRIVREWAWSSKAPEEAYPRLLLNESLSLDIKAQDQVGCYG